MDPLAEDIHPWHSSQVTWTTAWEPSCLFLPSWTFVPWYSFSWRNLASDPSIAPPFVWAVLWFACLRLCSAFLSTWFRNTHCWNVPLILSWPQDAVFSKSRFAVKTFPAASWCSIALWIYVSFLTVKSSIHSQDVSGTEVAVFWKVSPAPLQSFPF